MSNYFLVCGLGSLGQHCVLALKRFQVSVIAIEKTVESQEWEIPNLLELVDDLVEGDCRQKITLEKAKASQCRAALIVTSNEKVNAETAIALRQINPNLRLVVRSSKENLNLLLAEKLGNFIAYEPTELPASAFALAALGSETLGLFDLEQRSIRVVKRTVNPDHPWCNQSTLDQINNANRRLLSHVPHNSTTPSQEFYLWEPNTKIQAGDILIYAETVDKLVFVDTNTNVTNTGRRKSWWQKSSQFFTSLTPRFQNFWQLSFQQQIRRVAVVCAFTVVLLLIVGTILFDNYYPSTSWLSALYATAVLLLGGYADLFGDFTPNETVPWWLQLFALSLTVMGTAFVGVLYALLTEALLSSKFEFTRNRPPVPEANHIVVIGLGRVGRKVATVLEEFRQSVVGVSFNPDFDRTFLPNMPLVIGNFSEALTAANLETAKSVIVTTDDEMVNMEIALMARAANPENRLVIRTYGQDLTHHLSQLLPHSQVLCAYAVAAEAFAGAAFGENILSLFPWENHNILVTEYRVEVDDTLNGLLLSEVAYGYGVEIILYQKLHDTKRLMPSYDLQLAPGDRLVVLATIEALQRIEQGSLNLRHKCYFVRVVEVTNRDLNFAIFEGGNIISRISGCSLESARELMKNLPNTLTMPMYKHQAVRLVKELKKKVLVKAELAFSPTTE